MSMLKRAQVYPTSSSSQVMFIFGGFFFFQLLTAITEAMVAADNIGEAKSIIFSNISSDIRQVNPKHYSVLAVQTIFL